MGFDDYKAVLYRNQPDGWVAEIPAIPGCHALMPLGTRRWLRSLPFRLISESEYAEYKKEKSAYGRELKEWKQWAAEEKQRRLDEGLKAAELLIREHGGKVKW